MDQQPAQGEAGHQAHHHADERGQEALHRGRQRDLVVTEAQGTQCGEVVAPFQQQTRQGEPESEHRNDDTDHFQRIRDGKSLFEDAERLAPEVRLGVDGEPGMKRLPPRADRIGGAGVP